LIGVAGPVFEHALSSFLISGLTLVTAPSKEALVTPLPYISPDIAAATTTLLALLVGGAIGYKLYISRKLDTEKLLQNPLLRSTHEFLWNRLYINSVYYWIFVRGTVSVSGGLYRWIEHGFFDRISNAVSLLSVGLSKTGDRFDLQIVDGAVNGVASTGRRFSRAISKLQTGVAQQYLMVFAFGVFLLVVVMVLLGR
jgi:NADH:ubiquinone oxidoreductase subunit 5 (subunit L)/multisubunit Na+/H+ antiporter MnhA subunit